ncbi:hypothetical protein HK101_008165 [Irineochytrium annulatum]|nr:hypothetical protein HK101_008165 [Irineochytrium annulatum]
MAATTPTTAAALGRVGTIFLYPTYARRAPAILAIDSALAVPVPAADPEPNVAVADRPWLVQCRGWSCVENPGSFRRRLVLGFTKWLTNTTPATPLATAVATPPLTPPTLGTALIVEDTFEDRAGRFMAQGLLSSTLVVAAVGFAAKGGGRRRKLSGGSASSSGAGVVTDDEEDIGSKTHHRMSIEAILALVEGMPRVVVDTTATVGHFDAVLEVPAATLKQWREGKDDVGWDMNKLELLAFESSADLLEQDGISIVSDLDDTIKESDVHMGKRAAIRAAFYKNGAPVAGMSDAYQSFASNGCAFHYVSASPYQLFPTINEFLTDNEFPLGSLFLRDVWVAGNMSSRAYKRSTITGLMNKYPTRKFILIGDSGEKDAETFSNLYRDFPDKVLKVFIRNVTLLGPDGERKTEADERHRKQFEYVRANLATIPADRWMLFDRSDELVEDITSLLAGEAKSDAAAVSAAVAEVAELLAGVKVEAPVEGVSVAGL